MTRPKAHSARENAGKKTKSRETLEKMTLVEKPDAIAGSIFRDFDETVALIAGKTIEEKLYGITSRVPILLPDVPDPQTPEGENTDPVESDLDRSRAWVEAHCNDLRILDLEKMALANWQVIHSLRTHLAKHLIVAQSLKDRAQFLRARAESDLSETGPTAARFMNRLFAAEVTYNDFNNMSKERLARVVSAIKGVDASRVAEAVSQIPGMDDKDDIQQPDAETGHHEISEAKAIPSIEPDSIFDRIAKKYEEIGGEVLIRRATSPAERVALEMRWPDGIASLGDLAFNESTEVDEFRVHKWGDMHTLTKLINLWSERNELSLTNSEVRYWGMLLAFPDASHETAPQYLKFAHGLIMRADLDSETIMECRMPAN